MLYIVFVVFVFVKVVFVLFAGLDSYRLKERLVENEDFILVPAEAWRKLLSWYGTVDDQPALERKVKWCQSYSFILHSVSLILRDLEVHLVRGYS